MRRHSAVENTRERRLSWAARGQALLMMTCSRYARGLTRRMQARILARGIKTNTLTVIAHRRLLPRVAHGIARRRHPKPLHPRLLTTPRDACLLLEQHSGAHSRD